MNVSVAINNDYLNDLDTVVHELKHAGMRIEEIMPTIGIVVGDVDESLLAAVEQIPGVATVEQQREYLLPPDGNITA